MISVLAKIARNFPTLLQTSAIGQTVITAWGFDVTDGAGDTTGFSRFDLVFEVDEFASYLFDLSILFGDVSYTVGLLGGCGHAPRKGRCV